MARRVGRRRDGNRSRGDLSPPSLEDVEARATRLGITPERVLLEYARIAFADIRDVVDWDEYEVKAKASDKLTDSAAAAIAEIVASASTGKPYRIKLHDKKAVLDAIARHLGMLPLPKSSPDENDATHDEAESARERFIRELDRLAAERVARSSDPKHE
jgi:phage terminase small subunit